MLKLLTSLAPLSPKAPLAFTKLGRGLYQFLGVWILITWYTVYANERTPTGSGPKLVVGGPIINTPDRPDKTPKFALDIQGPSNSGSVSNSGASAGLGINTQNLAKGGAARLAIRRLALSQVGRSNFDYAEVRPYPISLQSNPCSTDCSGFVTLLYKGIGAADPNGPKFDYNGQGDTSSLQQNGTVVGNPNVGDLAFWSSPDHVAIVVSTGSDPQIVEFGGPPTPILTSIKNETPYHASFLGFRSYL